MQTDHGLNQNLVALCKIQIASSTHKLLLESEIFADFIQ